MALTIVENWKQALYDEGVSQGALRQYVDAFEHSEAEKAIQLNS